MKEKKDIKSRNLQALQKRTQRFSGMKNTAENRNSDENNTGIHQKAISSGGCPDANILNTVSHILIFPLSVWRQSTQRYKQPVL